MCDLDVLIITTGESGPFKLRPANGKVGLRTIAGGLAISAMSAGPEYGTTIIDTFGVDCSVAR